MVFIWLFVCNLPFCSIVYLWCVYLLYFAYFSAGAAMFLASVAETVYSYFQVSLRLVRRWVKALQYLMDM